jgi:hypothetical protein
MLVRRSLAGRAQGRGKRSAQGVGQWIS